MKYFGIFLLFLLLACGGFVYWKYFFVYSDGYREGKLNKFSKKGTFFKTHEGELWMQDLMFSQTNSKSDIIFYFSAEDPFVVKKLESTIGQKVKLHYTQYNGCLPWRGDDYGDKNKEPGQYMIDEVIVLGNQETTINPYLQQQSNSQQSTQPSQNSGQMMNNQQTTQNPNAQQMNNGAANQNSTGQ